MQTPCHVASSVFLSVEVAQARPGPSGAGATSPTSRTPTSSPRAVRQLEYERHGVIDLAGFLV